MAIANVLSAAEVRPVHVGYFDIKDDPIRGWTGPGIFAPTGTGDADLDSFTFESSGGAVDVTEFSEDQGIGGPITVTFAIGEDYGGFILGQGQLGDDPLGAPGGAMWDQLILDRRAFLGRKAVIWLGFLNSDDSAVLPEIQRMFTGVMVSASVTRKLDQPTMISVTCDQDLQKTHVHPARLIEHQSFYDGDTFASFLTDVTRGPVSGGASPYFPPEAGRPGGRGNRPRLRPDR